MQARTANWGDAAWLAVSEQSPCPICASNDGCQVHEEDDFASCQRVPSVWPLTNGAWLHRTRPPLTDEERAAQGLVHLLSQSELRVAG